MPPADWLAATEALTQRLRVNLSAGYDVDAILQYDAQVISPWTTDTTRLVGPGKLPDTQGGAQLRTKVSSAKTSLAKTDANAPSYVTFLIDESEVGVERTADLSLAYPINEVEMNVTPIVRPPPATENRAGSGRSPNPSSKARLPSGAVGISTGALDPVGSWRGSSSNRRRTGSDTTHDSRGTPGSRK